MLIVDRVGIGSGASAIQPGGVRQQWGSRVNCLLARSRTRFTVTFRSISSSPSRPGSTGAGTFLLPFWRRRIRGSNGTGSSEPLWDPFCFSVPGRSRGVVPGLDASGLYGACFCSEDGYFDRPQAVIAGFAATARAHGARIEVFDVAALRQEGSYWSIGDRSGAAISCDHVVIAAGCDSPAVLAPLGLEVPIQREARHLSIASRSESGFWNPSSCRPISISPRSSLPTEPCSQAIFRPKAT